MSDRFTWILKSGVNLDERWNEWPTEQFWFSMTTVTISDVMSTSPIDLLVISRPGLGGRRFTTKQTEQRIHQNTQDREAKINTRYFRRYNLEDKPHIDIELKKMESIERLRNFIFFGLAKHENASKHLSPNTGTEIHERLKRTLSKARQEAVQALWALV